MAKPLLLRLLPPLLRQSAYCRLYQNQHARWRSLYETAPLALCPRIAMHGLIPGDIISGHIAFNGFYEWPLSQAIAKLARGGGLLVDVGANMGYFSLLWAGLHPRGRAIAFEAAPRNIRLIQNNIAQNRLSGQISLVPKAAGRRQGETCFTLGPDEQTGWGGIAASPAENTATVPLTRLDQELPDAMIDVLKIDVEGADTWVLQGCEALLRQKRIDKIFFEQNTIRMKALGIAEGEALEFLNSLGYACVSFNHEKTEWLAYPQRTHRL